MLLFLPSNVSWDSRYEVIETIDRSTEKYMEELETALSSTCATDLGTVRINASAYYPSFHRNSLKVGSSDYLRVMRLRQIWAEGTFAVLKREHKLNKIQKRGFQKATEECFLSTIALNLKRLVTAV